MAYDEGLAQRIEGVLSDHPEMIAKKMFGGVGFMLRGNMACGVNKDDLIVRVGTERYAEALNQPHVKEFDITGRPMKGWISVEPAGCEADDDLILTNGFNRVLILRYRCRQNNPSKRARISHLTTWSYREF